jgi:hypothetical protein
MVGNARAECLELFLQFFDALFLIGFVVEIHCGASFLKGML